MSALLGLAGAVLLGTATVPQAAKLWRERRVDDFHWWFILLNFVGLLFLTMRSAELREWAFFAVNLTGACFWLFVFALKALDLPPPPARAQAPSLVRTG